MSDGFQYIDILLLGGIAVFLVLKLRSVLGKRTGHETDRENDPFNIAERQRQERQQREEAAVQTGADEDRVVDMQGNRHRPAPESQVEPQLLTEAEKVLQPFDKTFVETEFLNGACAAFEMIIQAFAKGDTVMLKSLLASNVYEDFEGAIKAREAARETLETTLVSIRSAQLEEARMKGKAAFVTVRFVSEQINVTRDAEGKKVDTDDGRAHVSTDLWTFTRDTRKGDPNWALVETDSPE